MYSNYDIKTWILLLLLNVVLAASEAKVENRDEHLGKRSKASMSKRKNLKVKRVEGDSLWLLLVSIEELVLLEPKVCHFKHLWYAGSGILSTPCAMWTENPASILLSCIYWHVTSQPADGDCTSAGVDAESEGHAVKSVVASNYRLRNFKNTLHFTQK